MASEGRSPGAEPASESSTVPTTETTSTTVGAAESTFTICGATFVLTEAILPSAETILNADRIFFEQLQMDGPDADVDVECGDISLRAHKELLMERIPYFAALFTHGYREQSSDVVTLSTQSLPFEPAHIRSLIDYSYHGELTLTEDNVICLLSAAVYLQMETIVEACVAFVLKRVRCETVLPLLARVRSAGYHPLVGRLWRYIDANFVPISWSHAFTKLSYDDVVQLLLRNSLRIDSEEQVLEAISRWMAVDITRWKDGARLLECCRLASLSAPFIELIRSKDWVKDNPDCLLLLSQHKNMERVDRFDSSIKMICCLVEGRDAVPTHYDALRRVLFGGKQYTKLRFYHPFTLECTEVRIPEWLHPDSQTAVVVGPYVHFLDIYDGADRCGNTTQRVLDTRANTWAGMPLLPTMRASAAIGVIDDVIYIAGGIVEDGTDWGDEDRDDRSGTERRTASTIAFDTRQSHPEWEERAPMTFARKRAASCVWNGLLFVFGGVVADDETTVHCEVYDPATNKWSAIAPLRNPCACASAVVANNRIFIALHRIAGATFEEYCPATDTWTRRADAARNISGLFVSGGLVISHPADRSSMMQVYSEATDQWVDYGELKEDLHGITDIFYLPLPSRCPLPIAAIESHLKPM